MQSMNDRKLRRSVVSLALIALALTGCSTGPTLETQWIDPSYDTQSRMLQGQKVLIACEAYDTSVRQICQDQLARGLLTRGATPVNLPGGTVILQDRELDAQLLPTARALGARAVFTVTLNPATTSDGSGVSLGIGGFSFGSSGGAGVGLSAPLGGGAVRTGFAANGRLTDARDGRLVWTATHVAHPSSDLEAQFFSLSQALLNSARGAGVF